MKEDQTIKTVENPEKSSSSRIHKLEKNIYDKIAAGEVVERPASIVKELVENAIDAGAASITVEIEKGGKKLIRVVDNGSGIHHEDVAVAFERHATSKINEVEDIYRIATLGFRGEALSSIAAVSHVTLTTRQPHDEVGTRVNAIGGKISNAEQIGCPSGTVLAVKDLFFNTPARLKFLKSDTAEQTAITDLMCKLAVSHPEIAFKYYSDARNIFTTRGDGTLLHTVAAVYGTETAKGLAKIDKEDDFGVIKGFSSKLDLTRGNKSHQLLFVNGRFVRSETVSDALKLAYGNSIPAGRHPVSFLFVEIDPSAVDVNIHPAKTEIKFHNDGAIKQLVYTAVREGLLNIDMISRPTIPQSVTQTVTQNVTQTASQTATQTKSYAAPVSPSASFAFEKKPFEPKDSVALASTEKVADFKATYNTVVPTSTPRPTQTQTQTAIQTHTQAPTIVTPSTPATPLTPSTTSAPASFKSTNPYSPVSSGRPVPAESKDLTKAVEGIAPKQQLMGLVDQILENEKRKAAEFDAIKVMDSAEAPAEPFVATMYDDLTYIGAAFRTYLLFEKGNDLYLLDQHAAHEKILYEDFVVQYKNKKLAAQVLMEPFTLNLAADDYQRCLNVLDHLAALGIAAEDFGNGGVIVREVPILFGEPVDRQFVKEIIEGLAAIDVQHKSNYDFKIDNIVMASCKGAIKANHRLNTLEVQALIGQLKKLKEPYTCPHGRPILVALQKDKIDRMFLRT